MVDELLIGPEVPNINYLESSDVYFDFHEGRNKEFYIYF